MSKLPENVGQDTVSVRYGLDSDEQYNESETIEPGDQVVVLDTPFGRMGLAVCYDLRFPELFRSVATRTDLFVVPANWPSRRGHAWRSLLAARAMDAQAWVVGVNRIGRDGDGVEHHGDTSVFDPNGELVASLSDQEGVVTADVDPRRVAELRARYGFLADRRPRLYSRLAEGEE